VRLDCGARLQYCTAASKEPELELELELELAGAGWSRSEWSGDVGMEYLRLVW
jgi:hypothetical protein